MSIDIKNFDYIILGSGPAGSTLANFLNSSNKIALIDSGRVKKNNSKTYSLKPFYVDNHPSYYLPQYSNVFGGNSELWANKIYLISKNETKNWPISHDILLKYSKELSLKLNFNHDYIYKTSKHINKSFFHRSTRAKINNIFKFYNIENKKNIHLFEKTTIKNIYEKNNKIYKVDLINEEGKISVLNINKGIILACGGLGNISMFMNLFNKKFKKDSYNLSDHCHFDIGIINDIKNKKILKNYINPNSKFEDCLVIEKNNIICGVQINSLKSLTLFFKRNAIKSNIKIIKIINLFLHKAINYIHKYLNYNKYSLEIFFNDNNKKNTITLSDTKIDKFGNKKININYEVNNYYNFSKNNLKYYFDELNKISEDDFKEKNVYVGIHPSCSTPIGNTKDNLSVDLNCKIYPFSNIYTIGSNIFPSNGITNPTWTLMAFAYRLSSYLNKN